MSTNNFGFDLLGLRAAGAGDSQGTSDGRFSRLEVDTDDAPKAPSQGEAITAEVAAQRAAQARTAPTRAVVPPLAVAAAMVASAGAPVEPLPALLAKQETDTSTTHGDIDTEGRARAIESGLVAAKHGLIPNEATFFSWGTRGNWGDKARKARIELRERPLIADAVGNVCRMVEGEKRLSTARQLPALTYTAGDTLVKTGGAGGARMTRRAFQQLLGRAGAAPYAATYLGHESVPAEMRAEHVRHWLANASDTEQVPDSAGKLHPVTTPRDAMILSKLDTKGERYVYGVVSDSYTRYDLDAVMRDLAKCVPATSRVAVAYNPESTRWRIDVSIGAEFEPVVGDIHRVTLRLRSQDAGGASVSGDIFAERARCLNFSKVMLRGKASRVRHIGADVATKVRQLMEIQGEALNDFAAVWSDANQTALIGEALSGDGEARDVFRALIKAGHLPALDGEELAVDRYFNAWLQEPGHTQAAFVNAATRAAHEGAWSSPWAGEAIEESAGELLYNRVVLAPTWREAA
jgi:hypothetical protein